MSVKFNGIWAQIRLHLSLINYSEGINSTHLLTAEIGFNYELKDHLKLTGIFKRIQGSGSQQTNNIRFGFHYISQRQTEYAMSLNGSDELTTGLSISKNINRFDLKMSSNYNFFNWYAWLWCKSRNFK